MRKSCKIVLKHGRDPDSKYNKRQLRIGTLVEMEHTDNPQIAKQITKAHLAESPVYYTYLKKMERQIELDKKLKRVI